MQRYIGMDVHAKSCSFGIIDQKNKRVRKWGRALRAPGEAWSEGMEVRIINQLKLGIVAQQVQVLPGQSLASRPEKSSGSSRVRSISSSSS